MVFLHKPCGLGSAMVGAQAISFGVARFGKRPLNASQSMGGFPQYEMVCEWTLNEIKEVKDAKA
jgi:hypothetical protein